MADTLKRFFDRQRVALLSAEFANAWPAFPSAQFEREASAGLARLELLDRGRHVSQALSRALPDSYPEAIEIVLRSLGPPLTSAEGNGLAPFHYLPHAIFVAERGLDHHALSMRAQHEITRRFTCEYSMRPFLEREPERTLAELTRWTRDPDEHVRRCVSESTRPRLPWAPRLKRFQHDPTLTLALLEALKDDPSEYVRRSVANHLNDVSKDHPALALDTCERWLANAPPERAKLAAHALRSLVRAGDARAIRLLGGSGGARVRAEGTIEPKRARIGKSVRATVRVLNEGREPAKVVLALRVHFVKARGGTSPKSFKLPTAEIGPGESVMLTKTVSLAQQTTRTHYPGEHRVEVVVNGEARPLGAFHVES